MGACVVVFLVFLMTGDETRHRNALLVYCLQTPNFWCPNFVQSIPQTVQQLPHRYYGSKTLVTGILLQ